MRRMVCRVSRTTLMARVLDTGSPPVFLESHVATCLRCQAAVAQAQRLRRALSHLSAPPRPEGRPGAAPPFGWAAVAASLAAALVVFRLRQQGGSGSRVPSFL